MLEETELLNITYLSFVFFYTLKSISHCIAHIWMYRVYRYDSHLYCTLCSLCFLFASLSSLPSTSDCKVTSLIRHTLTSAVNMWQMLQSNYVWFSAVVCVCVLIHLLTNDNVLLQWACLAVLQSELVKRRAFTTGTQHSWV